MKPYMKADKYGNSTIRNIYFDRPDFLLIRDSLEKPAYKEKLRVRSYRQVTGEDKVFIEVKKKFKGIVYKRRIEAFFVRIVYQGTCYFIHRNLVENMI